jgi:two-component SAPR family response regulator
MNTLKGYDLAIRIKELNDKIKVILISAYKISKNPLNVELLQKPTQCKCYLRKLTAL